MQLKIASTAKPGRTASSSDLSWKSPAFQDVHMSVLISTHHKDKVKPRSLDMSPEQEGDRYKKSWVPVFILFLFKESWYQKPGNWFERRGQLKMISDYKQMLLRLRLLCCLLSATVSPGGCSPLSWVLLTHHALYNTARLSPRGDRRAYLSLHFCQALWGCWMKGAIVTIIDCSDLQALS